ncbi:MAG TPA: hypothetical protein VFF06_07695, partial [Polyangia bacterium]|nr:hypothetical protein [Polyangia bacterium]
LADGTALPAKFAAHYSDQFGLRDTLLHWHALIKLRLFGVSPVPGNVVVGRDGWLYFGGCEPDEFRRLAPLTGAELDAWTRSLEERRDWLAAHGSRFLFVVAPNKSTIYPEHYPAALAPASAASRLDQLLEHLRAHSTVEVLDLRPALLARKQEERVYDVTDSHWNQRGAEAACEAIAAALHRWFPSVNPIPRSAYDAAVEHWPVGGDLSRMIALPDEFTEEALLLRPRTPPRAHDAGSAAIPWRRDADPDWKWPLAFETNTPSLPRAVILRDSFAARLHPFLSEHFQRSVYLFTDNFDTRLLESEKPDVVIEEMVERHLMRRPPPAPDVVDLPTM